MIQVVADAAPAARSSTYRSVTRSNPSVPTDTIAKTDHHGSTSGCSFMRKVY